MTKRKAKNKKIARGCGKIMSKNRRKVTSNRRMRNGCKKTKKGLALKRWFKEDWKDVKTGKKCGRKKGEKSVRLIAAQVKGYSKNSENFFGDDSTEKRSRITQKNRLGQPAGKPRRVKALKKEQGKKEWKKRKKRKSKKDGF